MKKVLTSKNITYFLLIIVGTMLLFRSPTDPDFGWHYKYGEYIFHNKKILRENIFSYTHTDYKWNNSYWLSQVIIYTSHHYLGSIVPTLILSAILSLVILSILRENSTDTTSIAALFIFTASTIALFIVTIRPLYYSTIFMFVLINSLLNKKKGSKFLPLMFLLWANMHADFVIGLFVLGCYCLFGFLENTNFPTTSFESIFPPWKKAEGISAYLERIKKYFSEIKKSKENIILLLKNFKIFMLSLIATFINPYGLGLWITLLKEVTQPVKSFVAEWAPMGELSFPFLVIGIYIAMGLLAGVSSNRVNPDKYKPWYVFLIVFFYPLSLKSVYFMRIFIIISSLPILDRFTLLKSDLKRVVIKDVQETLRPFFNPFLLFLLFSIIPGFLLHFNIASDIKAWSDAKKYPYEAVKYLKENNIQGRLLNEYAWGGYLIWQLPEHKTFIDGRMAAWRINGSYFIKDYKDIYYDTEENKELLEKYLETYDITRVLIEPDSKMAEFFKEEKKDWKIEYEDNISVIFLRNY